MTMKAVILLGGPSVGTRFRPLSFQVVKPLFPIAGVPMIQHHINALAQMKNVSELEEVLLIGFYEENEIHPFVSQMQEAVPFRIRYLREYQSLGTAGGLYHFRDQIVMGNPELLIVMHGDICSSFPLDDMLACHRNVYVDPSKPQHFTVLAIKMTREAAQRYGSMVVNPTTNEVMHYVEKPETPISDVINGGVYIFTPAVFSQIGQVFVRKHTRMNQTLSTLIRKELTISQEVIMLEQDVLEPIAGTGRLYAFYNNDPWCQIKTAETAMVANRAYLQIMKAKNSPALAQNEPGKPQITGNVIIHRTAHVAPSAKIGPDAVIGPRVRVGEGCRVANSIILDDVNLKPHACILNSVIGWRSRVGLWARVEGTKEANHNEQVFSRGTKNPGITTIGQDVVIGNEVIVRDCIVLPNKTVLEDHHNEILL
eukprot:comp9105_c0_seq1/m.4274 comp9105_c0_seq1/g.4274  ORF comp9105_c0_seq1/g.4274 comp9105_c0_seq1/m.4274 type:complete len:425 (-) comp9105_c0_seq1:465-1739(-)